MNKKTVKADKILRSTVIGGIIVIAVLGALLIRSFLPLVTEHLVKQDNPRKLTVIETVLTLIFLGFIPVVFYLFALGRRIIDSERFPSPGAKVTRDTQLLKGQKAVLRSQMMVFIAILLIVLALVGWMFTHFMIKSLTGK